MPGTVLARVRASPGRRMAGTGMLAFLGAICLWVALTQPPSAGWFVILLGGGSCALWLAWRQWQATAGDLIWTEAGLYVSDGREIAAVDAIERIERGIFAFKPVNGFLLHLRAPAVRTWVPGLWWRVGRRVGVGGVTRAAETRILADIIEATLAERS